MKTIVAMVLTLVMCSVANADMVGSASPMEESMLRAKAQNESYEVGETCYVNGAPEAPFTVVAVKGDSGPKQMVKIGHGHNSHLRRTSSDALRDLNDDELDGLGLWRWSHELIADLPELKTVQVAMPGTVDVEAMRSVMRAEMQRDMAKQLDQMREEMRRELLQQPTKPDNG